MKIQAKTATTTTVEGTVQHHELLAFVRQTVQIPAGAVVDFYIKALDSSHNYVITEDNPLRLVAVWTQDNKALPEQDMPVRIVTLSPVTKEGSDPAGTRT